MSRGEYFDYDDGFDIDSEIRNVIAPAFESFRPSFGFRFILLKGSKICFNGSEVSLTDYHILLQKLSEYSYSSISDLIDYSPKDEHFHLVNIGKKGSNIWNIINEAFPELNGNFDEINGPCVGQFALYTSPREEGTETKAPRVFFVARPNGILELLCMDLFHKLLPTKY